MQFSRSYLLRRPKSSSGKRRLAIIMAAAMLLALAVFLAVHVISTFNMFYNRAEWAQALRLQGAAGEVNYLVYGVDYWGASPYVERLVLILHHQDRETVNLVYIPGNTLIEGADGEAAPLGRLYRRLGNPAFIELVQDLTGLPVNHYLELHYAGIGVVADYLGGIDASGLPRGTGEVLIPPGKAKLSGFELYRYFVAADARESPWEQLERQRVALLRLVELMEQQAPWRWPLLLSRAAPYVDTDLAWREWGTLKEQFAAFSFSEMNTITLPGVEETREGFLYWVPGDRLQADLARLIDEGYEVLPESITVEVLNGCGVSGVAASLAELLAAEGFNVVRSGNADHFDYARTEVLASSKALAKARTVLLSLPGAVVRQRPGPEADVDVTVIVGKDFADKNAENNDGD